MKNMGTHQAVLRSQRRKKQCCSRRTARLLCRNTSLPRPLLHFPIRSQMLLLVSLPLPLPRPHPALQLLPPALPHLRCSLPPPRRPCSLPHLLLLYSHLVMFRHQTWHLLVSKVLLRRRLHRASLLRSTVTPSPTSTSLRCSSSASKHLRDLLRALHLHPMTCWALPLLLLVETRVSFPTATIVCTASMFATVSSLTPLCSRRVVTTPRSTVLYSQQVPMRSSRLCWRGSRSWMRLASPAPWCVLLVCMCSFARTHTWQRHSRPLLCLCNAEWLQSDRVQKSVVLLVTTARRSWSSRVHPTIVCLIPLLSCPLPSSAC